MVDKDFCLSSYMALRYIWKDNVDFYLNFQHKNFHLPSNTPKVAVASADDIDLYLAREFDKLYSKHSNIGILLSGGQDSAILASYLRPGSHAYTFTSDSGVFLEDQIRASYYCKKFNLKHHLVSISFDDYKYYTPIVMANKGAPVHSIEPQIYKAAIQAKKDGIDLMIIGNDADDVFGGMDKLLSKDWEFDEFVKRFTFLDPYLVLQHPVSMEELFEKYRLPENKIDYLRFLDEIFASESSSSYDNAFEAAGVDYYDPYSIFTMDPPLDLQRIRNGEPKYLITALYCKKYPELKVPYKIPMPRPVDEIFSSWRGVSRSEYKKNIDMSMLTGNQKWQLWCSELFLNMYD